MGFFSSTAKATAFKDKSAKEQAHQMHDVLENMRDDDVDFYRQTFEFLEGGAEGDIQMHNLEMALRAAGVNFTQDSLDQFIDSNRDSITFREFCFIASEIPDVDEQAATEAFETLFKNGASADDILDLLSSDGDSLNKKEASAAQDLLGDDDDDIDARAFWDAFSSNKRAAEKEKRKGDRKDISKDVATCEDLKDDDKDRFSNTEQEDDPWEVEDFVRFFEKL